MRFYFVRHGESEANLLHEFSNRGLKHPLTARGREQVIALAEHLDRLQREFERCQLGLLAKFLRGNLVRGNARLQIGAERALDADAGEEGARGACVRTGTLSRPW